MSTLVGGPAPQRPIPRAPEIKAYLYENAVMAETRRFRQLDRYEAFYSCRQYAHQELDWWGMTADQMETISPEVQVPYGFTQPAVAVSVRSRRPTAPYNLAKAVVDRFTGLLFSDTRRPTMTVEGDPATEDFLLAAMEQMRFWPKMREARSMGGALGSVLITAHLRDGRFSLEVHNPKHVQIVWRDRRTLQPLAAFILYRSLEEEETYDEKTGKVTGTRMVSYLHRRIITHEDDTVFEPVKEEDGAEIEWTVESTVQHGLGFFPGVWIQNLPVLESEDGDPDCHGAWQNFDTIDRLLSQMNKAALLNLDPTLVLSIDAKEREILGSIQKGSDFSLDVGAGGNAKYLEITGSGIDAGMKIYNVLKQNTLDVVRCVLVDPSTISGAAQSARAIEYIYAPMLEKADDLRAQYGDLGVLPLIRVIEAMARKLAGKRVDLPDGTVGEVVFDLPPKMTNGKASPQQLGPGGYIALKWGAYFAPTEQDRQVAVGTIVAAQTGGVIDKGTMIRQGAALFGIRDPEAVMKQIEKEQQEEMEKALASAEAGVSDADIEAAGGNVPQTGWASAKGGKP